MNLAKNFICPPITTRFKTSTSITGALIENGDGGYTWVTMRLIILIVQSVTPLKPANYISVSS